MKGIICAGGKGSRLYPLTRATNKHLLPVFDKPMIYYPIQTLVKAGIEEILIVVGGPHAGDFMNVLQNGEEFGLKKVEYAFQEKEGGIAEAIYCGKDFAQGDNVCVILGDNTTDADLSSEVEDFEKKLTKGKVDGLAKIFLKRVEHPERYGVAVFDKKDNLLKIEEKPKEPKSNMVQTGVYFYDSKVFKYIEKLAPSGRGELEVTDLNNVYLERCELDWSELQGFWSDAGTFESLYEANNYWAMKHFVNR